MNEPSRKVTKCKNYIMFTQLYQDKSKITSRIKTSQTGRIFELEEEKLGPKPLCTALISICTVLLCYWFLGTCQSPNWAQAGFLESPTCLLSKTGEIFQFGVHFPHQKCILPRLLPVCPNRGSEVIFCMFFDVLGTQNLPKFLVQILKFMISQDKSKTARHFSFGLPNPMRHARCATHIEKKPVF